MKKNICFDFSNMSSVDASRELADSARVCTILEEKRPQHGWRMPNIRSCTCPAELLREAEHINNNFETVPTVSTAAEILPLANRLCNGIFNKNIIVWQYFGTIYC